MLIKYFFLFSEVEDSATVENRANIHILKENQLIQQKKM